MDVLQFIRQMQEIYGDELIKPASELPRPQQALDREMFETAFKDKKADGGRIGFDGGGSPLQRLRQEIVDSMRPYAPGNVTEDQLQLIVKDITLDMTAEQAQASAKNNFIKLFGMADGGRAGYNDGQLVKPNADETRPGYAGEKKGYIKPLSPELQKLFNQTNPGEEWGKGRFAATKEGQSNRSNWRFTADEKKKVLEKTKGLISQADLQKILTEKLGVEIDARKIYGRIGPKSVPTKFQKLIQDRLFSKKVSGVRYYKKPTKYDIQAIEKSDFLTGARANTLQSSTVNNILSLDKKFKKIYSTGNVPSIDQVLKFFPNMDPSSAGTATARLAQLYGGHRFNNEELSKIRINKSASKKMFNVIDRSRFGNPYRNALYRISLQTIDSKLGNKIGTFERLKSDAVKILKDNKIPVYDVKDGKKAFGFNINEIAGATGSAKSQAAEFSQFVDIMEGNLNQKNLASYQGQLSLARQKIENAVGTRKYNKVFLEEAKKINKVSGILEKQFNVELPRIRKPSDVSKYYSDTRLRQLKEQGLDIPAASKRAGYTLEMPKSAVTAKEFVDQTPKATKGLVAFMKKNGIPCKLSEGVNCNFPQAYEKSLNELAAKAQAGDNVAQSKLVNFGKNVLKAGKVIKNVMGPYAVATEIALAVPSGAYGYAKGQPLSQIANTLTYGLAGESQIERLKKIDPNFGATQKLDSVADRFYNLERLQQGTGQQKVRSKPKFEKAERDLDVALLPFTTINPQIEAGRFLDPDAYTRRIDKDASLMADDQAVMKQRAIDRGMDTPENFGYGFARGGLSGGDTSGPPPEKGPMSQGLLSLYKNGRKL